MPETTPRPPRHPSWERGWSPDTSRAPGTRRLWLAGGLAAATVVACLTAISVDRRPADESSAPVPSGAPTNAGPGLLSFASPSSGTTAPPRDGSGPTPATPTTSAPRAPAPGDGTRAAAAPSTPSARPSGPGGSSGASQGSPRLRSVRSVNYPDRYWHVSGGLVQLDPVGSPADRRAATFRLVDGLADGSCTSFATADGTYLRHRDFVLRAERDDGSALFRKDATFCRRPATRSGAVVLESVNYPGRFLRHRDFRLRLEPYQDSELYRADSAFRLEDGLS